MCLIRYNGYDYFLLLLMHYVLNPLFYIHFNLKKKVVLIYFSFYFVYSYFDILGVMNDYLLLIL